MTKKEPPQDPIDVVRMMLDLASARDGEGILALLDDDLRYELMFMPDGVPHVVNSKAEMEAGTVETLARFEDWQFWMTSAYHTVEDPEAVVAEWQSEGRLKSGEIYRNSYIGIFKVRDGKIVFWRSYAHPNPMVLMWPEDHRPPKGASAETS